MMPIEFSVSIDRPVEEVFQYAADPAHLPEWGDGIIDCEIITDGPIDVGSVFIVKNSMGGRVQNFENEIVALEPNARFGFKTGSGGMGYTSNRTFEAKNGKTLVTERIDPETKGLMKLAAPLLKRFVRNSHYQSLLNLKANLEN